MSLNALSEAVSNFYDMGNPTACPGKKNALRASCATVKNSVLYDSISMLNTCVLPSLFATSRVLLPGKKARIPDLRVLKDFHDE